ncbi:hypothetical protein C4D60_Mb08t14850 [Musa balbisiana]|uniref:FLZ-type domain-containing protein n=1 Tax=Musa balbisiana TaxID=52838 RepID=A0A4S8K3V3_MUSBA|nr:hypothetical protein C4D60_Mb08t14850 [Musa balbisiana]
MQREIHDAQKPGQWARSAPRHHPWFEGHLLLLLLPPHLRLPTSSPQRPLRHQETRQETPVRRQQERKTSKRLQPMESSSFSCSSSSTASSSSAFDLEAGRAAPYNSAGAAAGSRSPKARFFCDGLDDEEPHHFLDSCFLCGKPLAGNRDIFMYRGDMPFCSEECRQEQIEMDESKEQNRKVPPKASSSSKDSSKGGAATGPSKSHKVHVRAGTAVAAG